MSHINLRRKTRPKTSPSLLWTQRLLTNRRGGIDRTLRPDGGKGSSSGCASNRGAEAIKGRRRRCCGRTAISRTKRRWIGEYPDWPSDGAGGKSELIY